MKVYRLDLLGQDGDINATETFSAPDNGEAQETARLVYDACNDELEGYELWRGAKRVAGSSDRTNAAGEIRLSDIVLARQENILDLEERLQRSFACIRRSRKLLETTATLLRRVHGESRVPPLDLNNPEPEARPGTLAATWLQLMRAADDPGISDTDRNAMIERADAVLDCLVAMPANTEADLAAKILFRPVGRR